MISYLKALLVLEGWSVDDIKSNSHNIIELFKCLDENDQINIKTILSIEIQDDVLKFMNNIKNDFTNMRYMYINDDKYDVNDVNNKFAKCIKLMYRLQNYVSLKIYGRDTYEEVINNVSI